MYALFMLAYSLKYTSYILNDNGLKDYETKKRKKKSKTIVEVLIKNHNSKKKMAVWQNLFEYSTFYISNLSRVVSVS